MELQNRQHRAISSASCPNYNTPWKRSPLLTIIMNANILSIHVKTWAICLFFIFATISYAHPPFDKALLPSTNISSTTDLNSPSNIPFPQPSLDLPYHDSNPPQQAAANAYPLSAGANDKQQEPRKSYEGDGIASGQPPPGVDIKGADNSAAKKLIPVYVVAGVLVVLVGIAVCWGLGRKHRKN